MRKFAIGIFLFFFSMVAKAQTIDFSFSSADSFFCSPSTIVFTQLCTGNPTQFIWSFGDNRFGSNAVETQAFNTPGTYTVKLTAIFTSTTLSISKTIVVQPAISSAVSVDRNYICQPGKIKFTGSGNGAAITSYQWDFNDGTPLMTGPTNTIEHAFANYGNFPVSLKVTSNTGCVASSNTVINITKLPIEASVSPSGGCVPALARFFAAATLPANSAIANYSWNFGDNLSALTTSGNNATHIYSKVGEYPATVTVTTNEGCTNTFNFNSLAFGTPPVNHIAYAKKAVICGNETAIFVSTAAKANRYFWNFGDGIFASTGDTTVSHKYTTVGNKQISVVAYYNECPSAPLVFNVNVVGVIAKFDFSNTCSNRSRYSFADISSGVATNSIWTFGDSTLLANVANPIHIFPSFGAFTTTLKLTDALTGCSDNTATIIYTATPSLINKDVAVCRNSPVNFYIKDNYTSITSTYNWFVVGQQTGALINTDTITVTASLLGQFNNYVVIDNGKQSCPDTINLNRTILVRGPKLNIINVTDICLNNEFRVFNQSYPYQVADSITSWVWNYGNTALPKDTVFQPNPVVYRSPGNFTVKLYATDKNGCQDSLATKIVVNGLPLLYLVPKKVSLCYGQSDTLFAFHSDAIIWSPSNDLSCTQCDTTIISPKRTTTYYATATNGSNCSVKDSSTITVSIPFTAAVSPREVAICANEVTSAVVSPKGKIVLWSPAAGLSNANVYNPVISPKQTTNYTITLSDSTGCLSNASSARFNVIVKSLPTVNAGPNKIYPRGASFTIAPAYSNNITRYLWTPATLLSCSDCAQPKGVNTYSQLYHIQVTSDSGCIANDSVLIAIECKNSNIFMPMAFTPNGDNLNDYYYPMAAGIKSVAKFVIFNRTGQVVFEASNFIPNDKKFGWNGKFKGTDQPLGSFVYTLQMVCDAGETIVTKGSFVLIR